MTDSPEESVKAQGNDSGPGETAPAAAFGAQQLAAPEASAFKKASFAPLLFLLGFAVLVAALIAAFVAKRSKQPAAATFQDLGAGISNASGLKGNLQVRWEGKAQYQLKFEPLEPMQSAGFSYVAADPPSPLSVNIRILDATGFALCGKEILFPGNGANPSAKDFFRNTVGDDGKVTAFSAQGVLPCSPDQFKQASYWDFTTNFPTLAEQDALMNEPAAARARRAAEARTAQRRSGRSPTAFTAEGDDRVTGYDASRNVLEARLGRDFLVTRANDRTVANNWAANYALFHYKCDQHARCALTHAGGGETIYVTALQ